MDGNDHRPPEPPRPPPTRAPGSHNSDYDTVHLFFFYFASYLLTVRRQRISAYGAGRRKTSSVASAAWAKKKLDKSKAPTKRKAKAKAPPKPKAARKRR